MHNNLWQIRQMDCVGARKPKKNVTQSRAVFGRLRLQDPAPAPDPTVGVKVAFWKFVEIWIGKNKSLVLVILFSHILKRKWFIFLSFDVWSALAPASLKTGRLRPAPPAPQQDYIGYKQHEKSVLQNVLKSVHRTKQDWTKCMKNAGLYFVKIYLTVKLNSPKMIN